MPNRGLNATWGREEWAAYVLDHLTSPPRPAASIDNVVLASGTVGAYGAVANAIFVNPADLTTLRLLEGHAGPSAAATRPTGRWR